MVCWSRPLSNLLLRCVSAFCAAQKFRYDTVRIFRGSNLPRWYCMLPFHSLPVHSVGFAGRRGASGPILASPPLYALLEFFSSPFEPCVLSDRVPLVALIGSLTSSIRPALVIWCGSSTLGQFDALRVGHKWVGPCYFMSVCESLVPFTTLIIFLSAFPDRTFLYLSYPASTLFRTALSLLLHNFFSPFACRALRHAPLRPARHHSVQVDQYHSIRVGRLQIALYESSRSSRIIYSRALRYHHSILVYPYPSIRVGPS